MLTLTKKGLRSLVKESYATDLSKYSPEELAVVLEGEGRLHVIGCSHGLYGVSGKLYQGDRTNALYVVMNYSSNLYRI